MKNNNSGFSLIETIISMFISLLISTSLCLFFTNLFRNFTRVYNEMNFTKEKLIKDKYIRNWTESIEIPYWDNPDEYLNFTINQLKQDDLFNAEVKEIKVLKDTDNYKCGISVTYSLSNSEEQTSVVQFNSISLVKK